MTGLGYGRGHQLLRSALLAAWQPGMAQQSQSVTTLPRRGSPGQQAQ